MIFQFLSLGRHGSEQRPSAEHQVLSLAEFFRIHQKIFLLRSNRCDDAGRGGIAKQAENPERLFVDHFHGAEQRRLFIQRLPAVRTEDSGNAEGVFFNKSVGRRVPGRIASGLKGGAQSARRKTGCVRFSFYQLFAAEFHNHRAIPVRADKAVMLFRRDTGHGLEPVGKMGDPLLHRPILHGVCHHIGHAGIQLFSKLHGPAQGFIGVLGKTLFHHLVIEYHTAK